MSASKVRTRHAHRHKAGRNSPSNADRMLDRVADATSLIATAASALEYAEDLPAEDDPADMADKVRCLALGLEQLSRVRIDIAVALRKALP